MEEIDLLSFFEYYKKYLLGVIAICLSAVLVVIIYYAAFKTEKFSTSTSVVLVKSEASGNNSDTTINQTDIVLNQKLVSTYKHIIKSRLVLEQVINDLKLDYDYEHLNKNVSAEAVEDTEILKITVTDTSPELAVRIADTVASVFSKEVVKIYKINNVSVLDVAEIPTYPSNYHLLRDIVLALFVSFVGVSGLIFVIFYYDDSLTDNNNVEKEIDMPIVARVFKDRSNDDLIVVNKPNAATSECIRNLRTNLQFSSIDKEIKTLLITSTFPSEGKSFVSANLAISFAQAGKKVLLMDCDLRKGRQHKIFKASSRYGLSNLLVGKISDYKEFVLKTEIENLYFIPRGACPPNPSELLNSQKMLSLLAELQKVFDLIILDGAPVIGLSDSVILSSSIDRVVLVASCNKTPKSQLINARKALEAVGANIAGCVLNNTEAKKGKHSSYYYYYGEDTKTEKKKK